MLEHVKLPGFCRRQGLFPRPAGGKIQIPTIDARRRAIFGSASPVTVSAYPSRCYGNCVAVVASTAGVLIAEKLTGLFNRRAFAIIELLAVVAILAPLVAILFRGRGGERGRDMYVLPQ
jgi:hypothetical protein